MAEIVISPLAKGNAYDSTLDYTYSADLLTWGRRNSASTPWGGFLGNVNTPVTNQFSGLFVPGAIVCEPTSIVGMGLSLVIGGLYGLRRLVCRENA